MKKEFSFEKAKEVIEYALQNFYTHDNFLVQYPKIKDAVSENCMLFRIGWYMQEFVGKNPGFANLNIDCQYNRNFQHPKSMFKQTLSNIKTKVKDPIPDLLFHQRGNNESNFFLVELKKGKPKKKELDNDVEKLCYFTDASHEYKYEYGFSIWLYKKNKAQIKVFENGKEMGSMCYWWSLK